MRRGLELEVVGPLPSRPYLDLTVDVLSAFGATVTNGSDGRWRVAPGGLVPSSFRVEGDWSAAAFAAAAVAVAGGTVSVSPLASSSRQGDRAVCGILERAGVSAIMTGERLELTGRVQRPLAADLPNTPDLFPALVVVAAAAPPGSILTGLDHLRHKESDRLAVMVDNLTGLGAAFEVDGSRLRVVRSIPAGGAPFGVAVTAAADHRIAMAMAVAALAAGPLELDDDDCVSKSFPRFWEMWSELVDGSVPPP